MQKLFFQRQKYGKDLLIDATHVADFALQSPEQMQVLPTFYAVGCLPKTAGKLRIHVQHIDLENNTLLFIPFGQVVDVAEARFEDGYFLFFEKEFLDTFFNEPHFIYKFNFFHNPESPFHLLCSVEDIAYFYQIFKEIHHEIRHLQTDSEHLIRALLYQFLIKANRAYTQQYNFSNRQVAENEHIIRFKAILETQVRFQHEVIYYADALQISKTHLNNLCQNYFGKPTAQILRERLLLEAKKELLYSTKTIAEISYDLQFSDPPNFTRFFKKMTDKTPQTYRELSN